MIPSADPPQLGRLGPSGDPPGLRLLAQGLDPHHQPNRPGGETAPAPRPPRDVLTSFLITNCVYLATAGQDGGLLFEDYHLYTSRTGWHTVNVQIFDENNNPFDRSFDLGVFC